MTIVTEIKCPKCNAIAHKETNADKGTVWIFCQKCGYDYANYERQANE